ncbi:ZIP family metal transporter [Geobacter anodireducens]
MNPVLLALGLTLFAGMATGIGSAIAFFAKRTSYRFLSVATGFSAGVMVYVSFVEILPKGLDSLVRSCGEPWGHWLNAASFFGGMLCIGLIDAVIPAAKNPHEIHADHEIAPLHDRSAPFPDFDSLAADPRCAPTGTHDHRPPQRHLLRMGLFTALAITIHNFPEGWPRSWRPWRIRASAPPLPWPLRSTISPRGSAFPCRSSTRPAIGGRHLPCRC